MIYVYAIIDRPEVDLPALTGLQDTSLVSLACQEIAAVYSPIISSGRSPEIEQTGPNVWKHEEVLEALMTAHTVLPVRFGEIFSNDTAVSGMLSAHYAEYWASMLRVRGRVELSLRVIWKNEADQAPVREPASPADGKAKTMSGYEYMQARLKAENGANARRHQAEAMALELEKTLARLVVESTHQVVLTSHLCLKTAFLIEKEAVPAFRQDIENLVPVYPEAHFLLTGPWPAYNFVSV